MRLKLYSLLFCVLSLSAVQAQRIVPKAPARAEGEGPFPRLIIRGVTLINGTGSPPIGPVDIVVEKNRIKSIREVLPNCRTETRSS